MKSGFIAIIGKPNAGKSTLLNALLNEKIAIVTDKAQTTRNAILGILNDDDSQIVFIDTPGVHKASNALGSYMNKEAMSQAAGVDVIYYISDSLKGLSKDDDNILKQLFSYDIPVFLILNKIDEINKETLIKRIQYASEHYDFEEIIPISALNKDNLDELLKTSKEYLNDEAKYYPDDISSVSTMEFEISEIIREKVINNTYQEVPHLTAVEIEELKVRDKKIFIEATIIVNKPTHKSIIIGKDGSMLRRINDDASKELKNKYGKRIVLSLYVKVEEDWLNKEKRLFELGYFKGDRDE